MFLIFFLLQWNFIHKLFQKMCIFVLELSNLHLTFLIHRLFHRLTYLTFFLFNFLFHLFFNCSLSNSSSFILFSMFVSYFSSSLNFSIIIYFFEGVKEKVIFGVLEKLTVSFDLVLKGLYSFSKSKKKLSVDSLSI